MIRPNHILIDPDAPDCSATVTLTEVLGDATVVHLETKGHALRSVVFGAEGRAVKLGDTIPLRIEREHLYRLPTT